MLPFLLLTLPHFVVGTVVPSHLGAAGSLDATRGYVKLPLRHQQASAPLVNRQSNDPIYDSGLTSPYVVDGELDFHS